MRQIDSYLEIMHSRMAFFRSLALALGIAAVAFGGLLDLRSFRGIPIVEPAEALKRRLQS